MTPYGRSFTYRWISKKASSLIRCDANWVRDAYAKGIGGFQYWSPNARNTRTKTVATKERRFWFLRDCDCYVKFCKWKAYCTLMTLAIYDPCKMSFKPFIPLYYRYLSNYYFLPTLTVDSTFGCRRLSFLFRCFQFFHEYHLVVTGSQRFAFLPCLSDV